MRRLPAKGQLVVSSSRHTVYLCVSLISCNMRLASLSSSSCSSWLCFLCIYLLVNQSTGASIANQVQAHHDLGIESPSFLTKMITHMFELFNLKQVIADVKISKTTEGTCQSCKFGIGLLQHLIQFGRGRDDLARLAHTICVSLKIESHRVCDGIVQVFKVTNNAEADFYSTMRNL